MINIINFHDWIQKYSFSIADLGPTKLENSLNLKVSYNTVLQSFAGSTWFIK